MPGRPGRSQRRADHEAGARDVRGLRPASGAEHLAPEPARKSKGRSNTAKAGVDSGEIILRGGSHLDFSFIPNPAFPASLRGADMVAWYTSAWFDKYLKHERSADARLLTTRWREDPIEAEVDPNHDGNAFSFYYLSRLDIHLADGQAWDCENLRAGCAGMVKGDGYAVSTPTSLSTPAPKVALRADHARTGRVASRTSRDGTSGVECSKPPPWHFYRFKEVIMGMESCARSRVRARVMALASVGAAALAVAAIAAGSASASTTWLCRPGLANNPCLSSEQATVVLGNGASFIENAKPAANAPIDCFYVYPTVSSQLSENANEEIDPEETAIAESQASRFSQVCKVYAPIYPQLTIPAINTPGGVTPAGAAKAYIGVLSAFEEYLLRYNNGRGFELIGHSQGSAMLEQLIKERIDTNPALRKQLVGAVILGGNVIVPEGKNVGGTFKTVPGCRFVTQPGCVIAYSSFLREPPNPSLFGRPGSPLPSLGGGSEPLEHPQVLCVNPTLPLQAPFAGPAFSYYPTFNAYGGHFPGLLGAVVQAPKASTPWVATPAEYSAQCEARNGASWLQLNLNNENDARERIEETLGPLWGTHLVDVNVALGNLVADVGVQGASYLFTHP